MVKEEGGGEKGNKDDDEAHSMIINEKLPHLP